MPFAAMFGRRVGMLLVAVALCAPAAHAAAGQSSKLDRALQSRAANPSGRARVIVRAVEGAPAGAVEAALRRLGGKASRNLSIINGHAGELPDGALHALAASRWIAGVSEDRLVVGTMERTAAAVGAASIRQALGYDGAGIGVAIVDSGITTWHDDLTGAPASAQRVTRFVDFVNGRDAAYDDYGHGTHVAGIVAGNGYDSDGARAGIAPAANLVVLKALDASGVGRVSTVIAALNYAIANKAALNIRVVNLSVRAGVYESYNTDPLTLAAQQVVRAGIVVVAAAGNLGRAADGAMQYGGVTAPGNAPWVLTVGASSHMGTVERSDDVVATFSSRGPGIGGYSAKPDLVAPGVGIESLAAPESAFYAQRPHLLLSGTVSTPYMPYLSLSGTSMSAPVVSGTVALMLQANPALIPNQVKAILQYTAQARADFDPLTQGAGFLNAAGAVQLALHFAAPSGTPYPPVQDWSRRVLWGNRLVQGGRLLRDANAWSNAIIWGATTTPTGREVRLGNICTGGDCDTDASKWVPWGTSTGFQNVVWGSLCGGDNCATEWTPGTVFSASDGVVWGMDADAVVWGVNDDGVVWGMHHDGVVWGMTDEGVVWGMSCLDASCDPTLGGGR